MARLKYGDVPLFQDRFKHKEIACYRAARAQEQQRKQNSEYQWQLRFFLPRLNWLSSSCGGGCLYGRRRQRHLASFANSG